MPDGPGGVRDCPGGRVPAVPAVDGVVLLSDLGVDGRTVEVAAVATPAEEDSDPDGNGPDVAASVQPPMTKAAVAAQAAMANGRRASDMPSCNHGSGARAGRGAAPTPRVAT